MLGVLDVTRCTRLLDLLAQHMAAPEINKANEQSLCFVYLEFDAKEHKQKAPSLFSTHQSTKTCVLHMGPRFSLVDSRKTHEIIQGLSAREHKQKLRVSFQLDEA